MNSMLEHVLLWAHLLCMVGSFGALLILQLGLPAATREDPAAARSALRFITFMVLAGFVIGVAAYVFKIVAASRAGGELPSATHMLVGMKFMIMMLVAGCLGMASSSVRKSKFAVALGLRWSAVGLLALAALMGVML